MSPLTALKINNISPDSNAWKWGRDKSRQWERVINPHYRRKDNGSIGMEDCTFSESLEIAVRGHDTIAIIDQLRDKKKRKAAK